MGIFGKNVLNIGVEAFETDLNYYNNTKKGFFGDDAYSGICGYESVSL